MRNAQSHDKSYQRGELVRTDHETAMNVLRNAQQVSQSHLVAHRELYTVPFPDTNHPDLELDYSAVPTKASSVLDTLTVDPDSFKVPTFRQKFLMSTTKLRKVGTSMLRGWPP